MIRSESITPFLAAAPAIFLMWILQRFPDFLVVKILIGLIGIFIVLGLYSEGDILNRNISYFGQEDFLEANKVLRVYNYILNHQADRLVLTTVYMAAFIFIQGLIFNHWWIIVALYYYTLSKGMGRRYMPPFVVALGESGSLGNSLVRDITKAASPLMLRELLRLDIISVGQVSKDFGRFQGSYRIDNMAFNWQFFVETYCKFAKLIVLDLRNTSANVDEECDILNKNDLWYKVLIITKDRSGLAMRGTRFAFSQDSIGKIPIFRESSELCLAVSEIAKDRQNIPSKERPAWLILSSANR